MNVAAAHTREAFVEQILGGRLVSGGFLGTAGVPSLHPQRYDEETEEEQEQGEEEEEKEEEQEEQDDDEDEEADEAEEDEGVAIVRRSMGNSPGKLEGVVSRERVKGKVAGGARLPARV